VRIVTVVTNPDPQGLRGFDRLEVAHG